MDSEGAVRVQIACDMRQAQALHRQAYRLAWDAVVTHARQVLQHACLVEFVAAMGEAFFTNDMGDTVERQPREWDSPEDDPVTPEAYQAIAAFEDTTLADFHELFGVRYPGVRFTCGGDLETDW